MRLLALSALVCGFFAAAPDIGLSGQVTTRARQAPTSRPIARLDVLAFGAVGNGVADDTVAFRKAIAAAMQSGPSIRSGMTIHIPQGRFRIRDPLWIPYVEGLHIRGAGIGATEIVWAGDGGRAMPALFVLQDARHCSFEGFSVTNESDDPLSCAFLIASTNVATSSVSNSFRLLKVDGGAAGVERAFRFTCPDAEEDVLNAWHVLSEVHVTNYLDAAYSLEHLAVRGVEFKSCRFEGLGRGLAGLASNRGTVDEQQNFGGSFRWLGGGGGGNRAADFDLGDVADTIVINGAMFEGSARFVNTGGPSGNQWPVVVESVVWLDDALGAIEDTPWPLAEQMRIVNFQFRGPLILTGNQFGVPPDPIHGPQVAKPSEVIWNPGNNFGQFIYQGNYLASSKGNPFTGVTATGSSIGIYPTVQVGNMVETEDFGSSSAVLPMVQHKTSLSGGATPTVGWLHTGRRFFTTGGGAPIENLMHGTVGQEIIVIALGDRIVRHNANLRLQGGQDFVMKDGDNLTLVMIDAGIWTEVARTVF